MDAITVRFQSLLSEKHIELSDHSFEQFEHYYKLLIEWNEKMNLTAITDREEVFVKHFYDSLSPSFYMNMGNIRNLADIGSGAGFPSLPLKIVYPHIQVTIIDSLNKRITFLKQVASALGLDGVSFIHGRAEDYGHQKDHRESYDMVTARAVARLNVLSEFCLPFVRLNGFFVAMKGAKSEEELYEAKKAIHVLGGRLKEEYSFTLPLETSQRHIIVIEKTENTPKSFPRKAGTPSKSPII